MTAPSPPDPIPVILNPSARNGAVRKRVAPVREAFIAEALRATIIESRSEQHATELAAEFAARGAPTVVSLGGDGLVRAVAAGLVGTESALGIIPGGRGNDFIGKLGIPKDIAGATAIVASGSDRIIDVLDIDGQICVGNVSLGLDSAVLSYADSARRITGHWVYLYGLARAIARPPRIRVDLTIDGELTAFHGLSAGFANSGRYGGGLRLSPAAELDDGLIDVVLFNDAPVPRLAVELLAYMFGAGRSLHPHIRFTRAREICVAVPDGADPIEISADGDTVTHTPATVRIRPAALRVRVAATPSPPG